MKIPGRARVPGRPARPPAAVLMVMALALAMTALAAGAASAAPAAPAAAATTAPYSCAPNGPAGSQTIYGTFGDASVIGWTGCRSACRAPDSTEPWRAGSGWRGPANLVKNWSLR